MGLFGRAKAAAPVEPDEGDEVAEYAREALWGGLRDRAAVVERVVAYVDDEDEPPSRAEVERIVAEQWAVREAELAGAYGPDHFEALARAFGDLERRGLLTRMDYGELQPHGHEMIMELPEAATARGYVFFSMIDVDSLSAGMLRVTFGPCGEASRDDTRAQRKAQQLAITVLAAEVTQALQAQGLTVTPDRQFPHILEVDVTSWHKPLPA